MPNPKIPEEIVVHLGSPDSDDMNVTVSFADYIKNGEKQRQVINAVNGKNVSYVLPQKIDKNAEKFVKLFFRVTGSYKNAKITIKSGDKILLEKTKKIVVPGEMENIVVPINLIKEVKDDIILSVEV